MFPGRDKNKKREKKTCVISYVMEGKEKDRKKMR